MRININEEKSWKGKGKLEGLVFTKCIYSGELVAYHFDMEKNCFAVTVTKIKKVPKFEL